MQEQAASKVEVLGSWDVDCVFLFDKFLLSRSLTAVKRGDRGSIWHELRREDTDFIC